MDTEKFCGRCKGKYQQIGYERYVTEKLKTLLEEMRRCQKEDKKSEVANKMEMYCERQKICHTELTLNQRTWRHFRKKTLMKPFNQSLWQSL